MTKKEIKDYLSRLHRSAFRNEKQIMNSRICGCFYCGSILKHEDIVEWLDDDGRGDHTAVCPKCGVDSVIGDDCGVRITPPFLDLMYLEYFGDGVGDTKVQIVKEETDGKVLMEIMVVSEAIQTILRREKYPQPYEALKALTRRIPCRRL